MSEKRQYIIIDIANIGFNPRKDGGPNASDYIRFDELLDNGFQEEELSEIGALEINQTITPYYTQAGIIVMRVPDLGMYPFEEEE